MTTWKQTFTGRKFDLAEPRGHSVCLADIAHSLALVNRFTGHTKEPYSVAQHCILVAGNVPPELRTAALLHDAHEAYIGDMSSPLKNLLGEYGADVRSVFRAIEGRIDDAIAEWAGIDVRSFKHPAIREADLRALNTERLCLMVDCAHQWDALPPPFDGKVFPWHWRTAESRFLEIAQGMGLT